MDAQVVREIPWYARDAYRAQMYGAKRRGIEWRFTLETWWVWWQVDDRWSRRGPRQNELKMCRVGDVPVYSPETVYAGTSSSNRFDATDRKRSAVAFSGKGVVGPAVSKEELTSITVYVSKKDRARLGSLCVDKRTSMRKLGHEAWNMLLAANGLEPLARTWGRCEEDA